MKVFINLAREDMFPKIIAGFPGVGKSTLFRKRGARLIADSDSSTFDKSDFPANYIRHIKQKLSEGYTVLVSTHNDVRNALVAEGMDFVLVYPALNCKEEYLQRYRDRGSPAAFVEMMDKKWVDFVVDCSGQKGCWHVCLAQGQFMPALDELPKLAVK